METNFRWFICLLLFLATTINYMDRQILALLKPILDEQLHWTNEQYGIVNSIFTIFYAGGLLLVGFLIDRLGTKMGYTLSIVGWSLAALAHALVSTISGFSIARAALGFAESGNFPAAIKSVAQWFPQRERAFATSLLNSGTNVGAMLAPFMVPIIALRWGWQAAFIIAGIAGFAWLLLWLPFFSLPQKSRFVSKQELTHIQEGQENEVEEKRTPWLQLLQFRQSWAIMALKFFTDPVWWFFLIWLPDFFKTTRGLDIKSSWFYLSTIYAIITILSIAGGWLTGRLMQRGWSHTRARKTMMLICACCVLPILGVSKLESFVALVLSGHASSVAAATNWLIVIIIGVAGAAHQAWSANVFTTVSDVFPKKSVGSMVGIAGMSGCISSIIFPIVCGRVLDYYKHQATIGYGILFGICAVAYLLALGVAHLISPHFDPVTAKDQNPKPSHP